MAAEIRKEVDLKTRFRKAGGVDSDIPLPLIKDLDLPDAWPGGIARTSVPIEPIAPIGKLATPEANASKVNPAVIGRNFGPISSMPVRPGPMQPRSDALTPIAHGENLTTFAPSKFLAKRVRALIGAGMSTEALAVLAVRLDAQKASKAEPRLALLYLKAKTLESLGDMTQATAVYTEVTALDRGTNAEGKDVFGIWAKSAKFALQHLRWLKTNKDYVLPDLEELK